jgi:phosphoglycerate dehydrogenase-like enzyme
MKPGACIINTARGGLVDEQDLYTALKEGWIAGAGLDAFNEEPLRQSPLFNLPNVVLTPHAGADTLEAANRTGVMAATEVIRQLAGQPPLNPVHSK